MSDEPKYEFAVNGLSGSIALEEKGMRICFSESGPTKNVEKALYYLCNGLLDTLGAEHADAGIGKGLLFKRAEKSDNTALTMFDTVKTAMETFVAQAQKDGVMKALSAWEFKQGNSELPKVWQIEEKKPLSREEKLLQAITDGLTAGGMSPEQAEAWMADHISPRVRTVLEAEERDKSGGKRTR